MDRYYQPEEEDRVNIACKVVRETNAAILVSVDPLAPEVWLPKSQIGYDGSFGEDIDIEIPEWLAIDKGLV